jgi:hypothetical protein
MLERILDRRILERMLVGMDDDVDKKTEESEIVYADDTGAVDKLLIIQQRDLSLHFLNSFCDRHKFFF